MVRYAALTLGIACHLSFLAAITAMALWLFGGMDLGPLRLSPWASLGWDVLLLLQFPFLHSLLLGQRGRAVVARMLPGEFGRRMVSTTFVTLASFQLLLLFVLWAPLGGVRWQPSGVVLHAWSTVYALSWVFLGVAMWNAGLATQMGYLGWLSVWRGREPNFGDFPTHGLYRVCRHPVYFAMALVALTGPVWTADHLLVAAIFCAYCVLGPLRKDARYRARFGARFEQYRRSVPFFPLLPLSRGVRAG